MHPIILKQMAPFMEKFGQVMLDVHSSRGAVIVEKLVFKFMMSSYTFSDCKENTRCQHATKRSDTFFCHMSIVFQTTDRWVVNSNCSGEYEMLGFLGTARWELV